MGSTLKFEKCKNQVYFCNSFVLNVLISPRQPQNLKTMTHKRTEIRLIIFKDFFFL